VGPVRFFEAGGKTLGANVQQLAVFSDGAVLATGCIASGTMPGPDPFGST
jgi:hypothetical protein